MAAPFTLAGLAAIRPTAPAPKPIDAASDADVTAALTGMRDWLDGIAGAPGSFTQAEMAIVLDEVVSFLIDNGTSDALAPDTDVSLTDAPGVVHAAPWAGLIGFLRPSVRRFARNPNIARRAFEICSQRAEMSRWGIKHGAITKAYAFDFADAVPVPNAPNPQVRNEIAQLKARALAPRVTAERQLAGHMLGQQAGGPLAHLNIGGDGGFGN